MPFPSISPEAPTTGARQLSAVFVSPVHRNLGLPPYILGARFFLCGFLFSVQPVRDSFLLEIPAATR